MEKLTNKDNFLFYFKEMSKSYFLFLEENSHNPIYLDLSISLQGFTEEISKSLNIPFPVLLQFIHKGEPYGKI